MNKLFWCYLLCCISFSVFAQDSLANKTTVQTYIPLQEYKSGFGELTKEDSLNFKFLNGDTLVLAPENYNPWEGKNSVRVPYEYKDSTFLNIYKNVVYNTHQVPDSSAGMRYWKEEVKIYFDESVPIAHRKELMDFANEISSNIDSLRISQNFIKEKSNFLVYYLNRDQNVDYEPRIVGKTGGYYINWNGRQQVYDGTIKINTENASSEKLQINLLKYYFIKSLGHFKSSPKLDCESFLSFCRKLRELSKMDLELLKYHYSYGVCKGVNLETFDEQTKRMNNILERDPDAKLFVVHHE